MKKKTAVKMLAFTALLAGAMMLSACSNGSNASNNSNSAPQNNVTPPADNTDNAPANSGNSGNAGNSGNSGNTANNGGNAANEPAGNAGNAGNGAAGHEADTQTTKDIKAMLELAKSGKVKGIPFAADKGLSDDVEKEWGKSDKTDFAGKGMYATYAKKHAVIGFNKGSQIFDVRSDAPELQQLTLKQIEAALGKTTKVTKNGTDTIYAYEAGKTFELRFIISADTAKVDHISVYAPADAVNNMAG